MACLYLELFCQSWENYKRRLTQIAPPLKKSLLLLSPIKYKSWFVWTHAEHISRQTKLQQNHTQRQDSSNDTKQNNMG